MRQPPDIRVDPGETRSPLLQAQEARAVPARSCRPCSSAAPTSTPAPARLPSRVYQLGGQPTVRLTYRTGSTEYWGIQETPGPTRRCSRTRASRSGSAAARYDLYYTGSHLHMVVLRDRRRELLGREHAARLALERDDAGDRARPAADDSVVCRRVSAEKCLQSGSSAPAGSASSRAPASPSSATRSSSATSSRSGSRRCARGSVPFHEPELAELLERNRERLTFTLDVARPRRARELLFVCVGTPPTYSGDADLSAVWTVVDELPRARPSARSSS